jgi:hypothetical protein
MKGTIAILWMLDGKRHSGSLEVLADRLELRGRGRTLVIPLASIDGFERGAPSRINGLAVLRLTLAGGMIVRVASLQGMGVLHQLAGRLAPAAVALSGT